MGGTVAITIRMAGGAVHRTSRWTNIVPDQLNDLKLAIDTEATLANFIAPWLEEQLRPAQQRPMYYDSPFLAPAEYGLIVIDVPNQVILDCNQYSRIGVIRLHEVLMDWKNPSDVSARVRLQAAVTAQRVAGVWQYVESLGRYERDAQYTALKWSDVVTLCKIPDRPVYFELDMTPVFTVEHFSDTADDWRRLRERLLVLNYVLSPQEEALWEKRIALLTETPED